MQYGASAFITLLPPIGGFNIQHKFPTFNFSKGKQYGFIAQEIEKIIPEMVQEATNPALYDKDGNKTGDAVSFKAVN